MSKSITKLRPIITKALKKYPTPFYIYDEAGIINAAHSIQQAFSWSKGFKNYFAVKATPNPKILKILKSEGMGFDCSSLTELHLVERLGAHGNDIMFTSNNTTAEEFKKARELGAVINLDDITHLTFLDEIADLPELLCFRYNPGKQVSGNTIIGHPEEAKFGMTKVQILRAIELAQKRGVRRFGLHSMVISNNLDVRLAVQIVHALLELAAEIHRVIGVQLEFINLGGGIGIPYKSEDKEFDVIGFSKKVERLMKVNLTYTPTIYMECGRYITGPYGYLITKVLHVKQTYKTFIGVDASMQNLMRPGMYGAYHEITVLNKEKSDYTETYDVTGSLCENNDKFAINRSMPAVVIGDVLVVRDAGAHGHAMGFNYNGKLRSAEILVHKNQSLELIRRAETMEDYFSTISF